MGRPNLPDVSRCAPTLRGHVAADSGLIAGQDPPPSRMGGPARRVGPPPSGRRALDAAPQTASASSAVGPSTITRTSGSVPLGRTSTRPRPSSGARPRARPPAWRRRAARARSRTRTLTSRCGSFSIAWRSARSRALERLEREQRRGDAVAGGDEAHVDDVAGLLAAERPAALAQRLEHVAVADRRRRDLDARRSRIAVWKP